MNTVININSESESTVFTTRSCSFCRTCGHTIRQCNHPGKEWIQNRLQILSGEYDPNNQQATRRKLERIPLPSLKMSCCIFDKPIGKTRNECIDIIITEMILIYDIGQLLPLLIALGDERRESVRVISIDLDSEEEKAKNQPTTYDCPICYETTDITNMFFAKCDHYMCSTCCANYVKQKNVCTCPMCRASIKELIHKQNYSTADKKYRNNDCFIQYYTKYFID